MDAVIVDLFSQLLPGPVSSGRISFEQIAQISERVFLQCRKVSLGFIAGGTRKSLDRLDFDAEGLANPRDLVEHVSLLVKA
jgi:hypothetical protein